MSKAFRATIVTVLALALALFALGLLRVEAGSPATPTGQPTADFAWDDLARPPMTSNVRFSGRYLVQLADPPLASYKGGITGLAATAPSATGAAKLATASAATQAYVSHLQAQQAAVEAALKQAAPASTVERHYQTLFNGLAVRMSASDAEKVRGLAGVKAVVPDQSYSLLMDHSLPLIGAPQLWQQLGGAAEAGRGVKVAVVDTGIYISHTLFNPAGFQYPPGFPKGDTRFTTPKVIASRAYFRPNDPPRPGHETPLPDPGADFSHATHVGGTIAGAVNTTAILTGEVGATYGVTHTISGVAPGAWLMNYKVFYAGVSGEKDAYSAELIAALEDAVLDGADVISNSWGGDHIGASWVDPIVQAAEAAVDAGVVVVFAAGNSGSAPVTLSSPAVSPRVITVGASSTPITLTYPAGRINVTAPTPVITSVVGLIMKGMVDLGPPVTRTVGPLPYVWAGAVTDDHDPDGCHLDGTSPYTGQALEGKILLVQRGTCLAVEKVRHAQAAGARAVVIYERTDWSWDSNCYTCQDVVIPVVSTLKDEGHALVDWYTRYPTEAQLEISVEPRYVPVPADAVTYFSSRGPTPDLRLKPDVIAPGLYIVSGGYGPGDNPHAGFGVASGTSMATPHVAGSAALLRQLHPDWSPDQVKSALMTTARIEGLHAESSGKVSTLLDTGAGRIDLRHAGDPGVTLDTPSLVAQPRQGTTLRQTVHGKSVAEDEETYAVTISRTVGADTGVILRPAVSQVQVAPGASLDLEVQWAVAPDAAPGDYEGLIWLRGAHHTAHIPYWVRVLPAQRHSVLLLDQDGSSATTSGGPYPDYARVYTETLERLGIRYTYFDGDKEHLAERFSVGDLLQYQAVIWFTGDSRITHGDFKTWLDQQWLIDYLNSGGRLLATGQNLATVASLYSAPGESLLYQGYLAAEHVQDNVFAGQGGAPTPTQRTVRALEAAPFLAGMTLDLSGGNQDAIDEIAPNEGWDVFMGGYGHTQPLFRALGDSAVREGVVGVAVSAEPTLAEGRQALAHRAVYLSFGLEGVQATPGYTSRDEVTRQLLGWLTDETTLRLSEPMTTTVGTPTTLTATATSSIDDATFDLFRWDFGDGTMVQETLRPSVLHTYSRPETYTVRVEMTDSYWHTALASKEMVIVRPTRDDRRQLYLPYVLRAAGSP